MRDSRFPPGSSSPQVRGVMWGCVPGRVPGPGPGCYLPFGSFRQFQPVAAGPAGLAGGACCALRVLAGIPGVIRGLSAAAVPWRGGRLGAPVVRVTELSVIGERPGRGGRAARIASGRVRYGHAGRPPGCVNLRLESWCWRELWSSARHLRTVLSAAFGKRPFTSLHERPSRLCMNDRALGRLICCRCEPFTLRRPGPPAHLRLVPDGIRDVTLPSLHTFAAAVAPAASLMMWLTVPYRLRKAIINAK